VKEKVDEMLTVKFRYKAANGDKSRLIVKALSNESQDRTSDNFRFSAAVAGFGMLLRGSEHKGDLTYDQVMEMARGARGKDRNGYRAEFIRMVERAQLLASDRRS
jgi:Ca-activated chloride channel family protein